MPGSAGADLRLPTSPLHWTIGPRTCCKDGPVLPFSQVDVFTSELTLGNPVAVVHVGDGSRTMRMAAFARWTNLSETTFLLTPTDPAADYRVRIFTPVDELPFAGHPPSAPRGPGLSRAASRDQTGTSCSSAARVWFASRQAAGRLAFAAPALVRSDRLDESEVGLIAHARRLDTDDVVDAQWADNGPGWVALLLADAETVLAPSCHRRVRQDRRHRPPPGWVRCRLRGPRTHLEERARWEIR